jgi:hypothetical protein
MMRKDGPGPARPPPPVYTFAFLPLSLSLHFRTSTFRRRAVSEQHVPSCCPHQRGRPIPSLSTGYSSIPVCYPRLVALNGGSSHPVRAGLNWCHIRPAATSRLPFPSFDGRITRSPCRDVPLPISSRYMIKYIYIYSSSFSAGIDDWRGNASLWSAAQRLASTSH